MIPSTNLVERVGLGAAWLDANLPGWRGRVDVGRLDLGDVCDCVLGQALQADAPGEFYVAAAANADSSGFEAYPGERWAIAHGFDSEWGLTAGGRIALLIAWVRFVSAVLPQRVAS